MLQVPLCWDPHFIFVFAWVSRKEAGKNRGYTRREKATPTHAFWREGIRLLTWWCGLVWGYEPQLTRSQGFEARGLGSGQPQEVGEPVFTRLTWVMHWRFCSRFLVGQSAKLQCGSLFSTFWREKLTIVQQRGQPELVVWIGGWDGLFQVTGPELMVWIGWDLNLFQGTGPA